jgi:myo-inositol-1(or 4)-monophosphatase
MTIEARLTTAAAVIREAGVLAAKYFAHGAALTRETKGPQDFVSLADREVEALIRTRLAEAFPDDGFLGEESGGPPASAAGWSTQSTAPTNFLCGLPLWGVSLAYAIAGDAVSGLSLAMRRPALRRCSRSGSHVQRRTDTRQPHR